MCISTLRIKGAVMANAHTISCNDKLWSDFQNHCFNLGTKPSSEIQAYMKSVLEGKEQAFKDLQESVEKLSEAIDTIESRMVELESNEGGSF